MILKILIIIILYCINLSADDAPLHPVQGGTVQTFYHSDIQLKNEVIDIFLFEDKYDVTVQYVFINKGKKQKVCMGFPNQTDSAYTRTISDFKAYAQEKKMKIFKKFKVGEEKKNEYEPKDFFECFDTVFKKGEEKKVKNVYSQEYITDYDMSFRKAEYILKTGALWKDKIERIDVRIHFKGMPKYELNSRKVFFSDEDYKKNTFGTYSHFVIHPETYSHKIVKDTVYLAFTDIEPTFNIGVTLPPKLRWSTSASSVLKHKRDIYNHKNIIDHDPNTAWVEGKKGYGIGEKVNLIFEPSVAGGKLPGAYLVKKIGIVNGYAKSVAQYKKNSRVKKAEILFTCALEDNSGKLQQYEKSIKVDLKDQREEQYIVFKKPVLASQLSLKILDIYKGSKHKDTCISEIYIYVKE